MCLLNTLSPVFMFAFIFHCRSFSLWWPLAFSLSHSRFECSCFSCYKNSSAFFSITRSNSFSVIHVSVNIKNNVEKDTTWLFFLSKSPAGHTISFQIKPWIAFGLPYLLIELFYIGMPVVRTNGRSGGVRSRDYQIFSDRWFTHFLLIVLHCARFARESSAIRLRDARGRVRARLWCPLPASHSGGLVSHPPSPANPLGCLLLMWYPYSW